MEIKLFGMKARLELLVLILLAGLYIGSSLLCNCMRYEGMTTMNHGGGGKYNPFASLAANKGPAPGPMLVFGGDRSSGECCPATYSTSEGCICATEEQMRYLAARGGNRAAPSDF